MDNLKCVWENLRKPYTRCKRDREKMMRSGAKTRKLPSRQFYGIMKFLEDNTNIEDHQQNEEDNDVEEETAVESVGGRSFYSLKRKRARGYRNADQKRLMDALHNVGRQLKEVTDNEKYMENSIFLFCKSVKEILEDLHPEQDMEARIKIQPVLFGIKSKK